MNAIYLQALRETNEDLNEGTVGGMVAGAGLLAAGYGLYKGGKTLVKGTKQIGRDVADLGKAGANKIDERMNKVRDYNARQETLRKERLSPEEREAQIRAEERNKRLAGYVAAGTGAYLLARHRYKKNEDAEDSTPIAGEGLDEGIGSWFGKKVANATDNVASTAGGSAAGAAYDTLKSKVASDMPAIKNAGTKAAAALGAAYIGKKMLDNHFAKRQEILRTRARMEEERRQEDIDRRRQQKIEDEAQKREEKRLRQQASGRAVAENSNPYFDIANEASGSRKNGGQKPQRNKSNCEDDKGSNAAQLAAVAGTLALTGGSMAYSYYKKKKAEQEAIKAEEEARRKAQEEADNARVDKRIKDLVDRTRKKEQPTSEAAALAMVQLAEAAGMLPEDAKSDYQANMDALRAKYTGLGVQSARKVLGDFKTSNPEGYKELRTLAVKEAGRYAVTNTVPAIKDAVSARYQYHKDRRAEKRAARNESAELTLFKEMVDRAMNV